MADDLETTAAPESSAEPEAVAATSEPVPSQSQEGTQQQDTFFDPKALSPELQTQWKSMQRAYTKRMQQFAANRDKADLVDRFNSDPSVRRQILQQYAHELGLQVNRGDAADTGAPKSK